jgi:hypothetical protein
VRRDDRAASARLATPNAAGSAGIVPKAATSATRHEEAALMNHQTRAALGFAAAGEPRASLRALTSGRKSQDIDHPKRRRVSHKRGKHPAQAVCRVRCRRFERVGL